MSSNKCNDKHAIISSISSRPEGTRKRISGIDLIRTVILVSSVAMMLPGAWGHSATVVEFAQLPAGLAAWQSGSLGIYRVCGPVSKMLYALPAHLAGVRVDYPDEFDDDVRSRREWELGQIFQNQNVKWYHDVYRWSRLLPILVTVLGGCLVCEWSTRLFGVWPGVASLCVWCWSPPILGHGSLVTSDAPAAVAALAAARVFWAFLLKPNVPRALAVGLTLGLAAATKFTLLILYPCWTVLAILRVIQLHGRDNAEIRRGGSSSRIARLGFVALTTSVVALDACYLFQGVGFRLGDWESDRSWLARTTQGWKDGRATAWMLQIPLPIPREILHGLDFQIADGERVQSAYLLGETRVGGWWFWYPTAFLLKNPLPFLIILVMALCLTPRVVRGSDPVFWAALCLFAPAVEAALAVAASTGTGTNAAFRYLLPSLALASVWTGAAFTVTTRMARIGGLLLAWMLLDAMIAVPDHLGWRNEAAQTWELGSGRPALIGDSLDWGQDLARLEDWIARHANGDGVQVCVYGLGSGRAYGLARPAALPAVENSEHRSNYLAISVDVLFGYANGITISVDDGRSAISEKQRAVLTSSSPYARVGRTIQIHRLKDLHTAVPIARSSDPDLSRTTPHPTPETSRRP